jgi:hypothetical protein
MIHVLEPEVHVICIGNILDKLDTHHDPSLQKGLYKKSASFMSSLQTVDCILVGSLQKKPRVNDH